MIPAYVIHLKRSVARRANAEALCRELGKNAAIVHAVDSQDIERMAREAQPNQFRPHPRYPFPLKPTEHAAFLSHRACWQRLLDDGHDAALVVEDDVRLQHGFEDALNLAMSNLQAGSVVRFPWQARESMRTVVASSGSIQLYRPKVIGLGMLALIVSRDAARRLLAASERFDRPVDAFLQMSWVHGVDVMSVWPSGVVESSREFGGSTIHSSKSLVERLKREALRPAYRLAVALHSRWQRDDR